MTAGSAELEFPWGDGVVRFRLLRSERGSLRIAVAPDGEVTVHAPLQATDGQVVERVARRAPWIARQLQDFDRWRPRTPPRQYVDGETHLYLGRPYRLRIEEAPSPSVEIRGDRLVLGTPAGAGIAFRRTLLGHWYSVRAHRVFPERLACVLPGFERHGIRRPRLIIRELAKRWGSFTPAGSLVLNRDLIRASPSLIDYVVAHELAHALHPDHGPDWAALLSTHMPDWTDRKAALERQLL